MSRIISPALIELGLTLAIGALLVIALWGAVSP
jgi:hypothetical protein